MTSARKPRIYVTQPIAKSAIERLREVSTVAVNPDASRIIGRHALIAAVRRCHILFCLLHDQIDAGIIRQSRAAPRRGAIDHPFEYRR
jgi:glyoxylate reductase